MADPFDSQVEARALFDRLGMAGGEGDLESRSPIDGRVIGRVGTADKAAVAAAVERAHQAFLAWRLVPAPRRGELVRLFGEVLREEKEPLGRLVSLEAGKILQEGLGEVQEMIDICDFAVGLSRQLYGLTIATERPGHRMMETWHPLGVVGVISAFNFPVAVWAWNACLALVCGDTIVWKPSEKTPLTAVAVAALFGRALDRFGDAPAGLLELVQGGREAGEALVDDPRVALVSATGSTRMGREVGPRVAARFGRSLLELGGNNGMIVAPSADLHLAERAIAFAAAGTAGQRCTSLRRLLVQEEVRDELVARLKRVWSVMKVGNPLEDGVLVGPLIDRDAYEAMQVGARRGALSGRHGQRRRAAARGRVARGLLRAAGPGRDASAGGRGGAGDLRADPLRPYLPRARRGDRPAQCGAAGAGLGDLHHGPARGRAVPLGGRLGLRDSQRQYRAVGRGDRRRVRRREGDRRGPRKRLGRLARLHAPVDQHDQLRARPPLGPRH